MSLYLAFHTGATLIRPSLNAQRLLENAGSIFPPLVRGVHYMKFHGARARKLRNVRVTLSNHYYEEYGGYYSYKACG